MSFTRRVFSIIDLSRAAMDFAMNPICGCDCHMKIMIRSVFRLLRFELFLDGTGILRQNYPTRDLFFPTRYTFRKST
jgi:hypothetical protein